MAEFDGIFTSLSAVSIDNRGGGWDGWWGRVGWRRVGELRGGKNHRLGQPMSSHDASQWPMTQ